MPDQHSKLLGDDMLAPSQAVGVASEHTAHVCSKRAAGVVVRVAQKHKYSA